jgi:hypothetical protein
MKNSKQRDKVIENYLEVFQQQSSQLRSVINLLSTKKLKDKITLQSCKELVYKDLNGLIELLNQLAKGELKEKIILDSTEQLAKKSNLTQIITLVNKTASNELRTKIKERYRHLVNKSIEEYKNRLYNLENIQIEQKRESIIEEAHTIVDIQKSQEKELDLESATVEILSSLVINVENQERQRELLSLMITKMKSDKSRDYSKIAYKSIVDSQIYNHALYELEEFIESGYFKENIREFKERKETEQSINKMLGKVLRNREAQREEVFMKQFKRLRKIKDLDVVIPYVAKRDFELAQSLMKNRIDEKKSQEVQKFIFLNEYQQKWDKAIMAYEKIDDFYIKVELSKIVLERFIPHFTESFFIEAMVILDSQNIANTPKDLLSVEPVEVLKYYEKIEEGKENLFNELEAQIVELQQRATLAEEIEDENALEQILEEEKKLKNSIKADEKLFELFLERYDLSNLKFMRLSLLDFEL